MPNRIVTVDDALRLPTAVRAQLKSDVEADVASSVSAAQAASSTAESAAVAASTARNEAVAAAASATEIVAADLDSATSILLETSTSEIRTTFDSLTGASYGRVVPVKWTGSAWPSRPAVKSTEVVLWIGNPLGTAPPEMALGDIWTREEITLDGVWQDWIPTMTAASTNPTFSEAVGRFVRNGDTIRGWGRLTFATAGAGVYFVSLPTGVTPPGVLLGPAVLTNTVSGVATRYSMGMIGATGNPSLSASFHPDGAVSAMSNTVPAAVTSGTILRFSFSYEAL